MSEYQATLGALGMAMAVGIPTVLWGDPGEGKTSVIEATAAGLGYHLEVVIASLREPADFAGLPVPDLAGRRMWLAPPDWAVRLVEAAAAGRRPAVFFDEISCAAPATQAALLRVCCDRVVGDLVLPAETVVLAAANPPSLAADGWDLAPPMANRFCHLDWRLPASVVADGFLDAFPDPVLPTLPAEMGGELRRAKALVGGYLRARPTDVSVVPTDPAAGGRAFPTPRSWEYAARLLAACTATGAGEDIRRRLIGGVVGDGAGLQFLHYLQALDLPDPEGALADPAALELPERGDQAYAVLSGIVAAVLADLTPARWAAGVRAVSRAADLGKPDVGAAAIRALLRHRPTVDGVEAPVPAAVAGFAPVLRAAGLLT